MTIILTVTVILVIGILLAMNKNYDTSVLGTVIVGCSLVVAIIIAITLPLSRMSYKGSIEEYKATKYTIEESRKKENNEAERVSLSKQIMETNMFIERNKRYNKSIFDLWIPDEIENLKMLK